MSEFFPLTLYKDKTYGFQPYMNGQVLVSLTANSPKGAVMISFLIKEIELESHRYALYSQTIAKGQQ